VVAKGGILLGIKNLQEGRRRIAAKVSTELVDFVEHEDGVVGVRLANTLDHAPWQRGDIGPAMTADFGFVMHAAQANPHEFTPQCLGDTLAQ
jgi:hypothetical protein